VPINQDTHRGDDVEGSPRVCGTDAGDSPRRSRSKPQPAGPSTQPTQRLCVEFAVHGPAQYLSTLDQARVWVRALRRMGLQLSYSAGFNPHPRLVVAAPLPVGYAGEHELLEFYLDAPVEPAELTVDLASQLPQGLEILQVQEVPLQGPALPARVAAADYVVLFAAPPADLSQRVEQLLAAAGLPFTRVRQAKETRFDLRPRILSAQVSDGSLTLRLTYGPEGAARPDDVVSALGMQPPDAQYTRTGLVLRPDEGRGNS
jgi:radical SAM-linked protein